MIGATIFGFQRDDQAGLVGLAIPNKEKSHALDVLSAGPYLAQKAHHFFALLIAYLMRRIAELETIFALQ